MDEDEKENVVEELSTSERGLHPMESERGMELRGSGLRLRRRSLVAQA